MRGASSDNGNGVPTLSVQCPNCGFPNLEEVEACISCGEALPAAAMPRAAPVAGDFASSPSQAMAPPPQAMAPPVQPPDAFGVAAPPNAEAADKPHRDPNASIEMFFPQRHGELPTSAGANPEFATEPSSAPAGVAGWGGGPAQANITSDDPWLSAYDHPQTLGATVGAGFRPSVAHVKKPVKVQRFAPTDFVTVVGVLTLFVSLVLPWATKVPTEEVEEVVTAGSFPMTFLLSGFQESYALPWFTAFVALALCGVAAVLGTMISERPSSYMIVSTAGLAALLISAAFLVKLATLQTEVEAAAGGFSHGVGIYVAIVASVVILAGATLRSNRIKSS